MTCKIVKNVKMKDGSIIKIESCNNIAEERTSYPSKEQIAYLNACEHTYYICEHCEDKGWKYNTVYDEYYFSTPRIIKIDLSSKRKVKGEVENGSKKTKSENNSYIPTRITRSNKQEAEISSRGTRNRDSLWEL